jgi:hypothetical protein
MDREKQVLFAGFGGQGVLSMGQFLTHIAMNAGKEVAYFTLSESGLFKEPSPHPSFIFLVPLIELNPASP